jgi:hypothetical protein
MRLSVLAALLSVGFFAGCGGVEWEEREVRQALTPCERDCLRAYGQCEQNASTPEQYKACDDRLNRCTDRCELFPSPEPRVEAMRPPPCEYACELAYVHCLRSATTQEQRDACLFEQGDCNSLCDGGPR